MDQPIKRSDAARRRAPEPGAEALVAPIALIQASAAEPVRYRQISIQRPPRTLWERLRARFGARFFEVRTERATPDD
jgi:hypothetical protein